MSQTTTTIGTIVEINGLFVRIARQGRYTPQIGELLGGERGATLLVESVHDNNISALILAGNQFATRAQVVEATGQVLQVPTGTSIFGRVFDAFGNVIDGGEGLATPVYHPITIPLHQPLATYKKPEIIETGIKVIDFMAPFVKGRRIGIIGGAGVGKTVLTTEIMHNVADKKRALNFFVGIGERMREGHELYHTLGERGLIDNTVMFMGQMNENAVMRSLVGQSASAVARIYAQKGNDVLFFVDNIYRFVQANNELATMRGDIPQEGGYQSSLFTDLHRFEDGLQVTSNGSVTSVQSIFVPADDLSDPAVVEIGQQLDSTIVLSREVFEQGIFPAVDLLNTTSSLITPDTLGERHCNLLRSVKAIMRKHHSLRTIIAIVGESELSFSDRADYERAENLIRFFSQNMFVTEDMSGRKGEYFSYQQTLDGVSAILE